MSLKSIGRTALSILIALAFIAAAYMKLTTNQMEVDVFAHFGYAPWFMYLIGILELLGGLGVLLGSYVDVRLPRLAAGCLLALMMGVLYSHATHDPVSMMIPAIILTTLLCGYLYITKEKTTS